MRIDIMSKYQVKYKNKYSQREEDDVFKHYIYKWNRNMYGDDLINIITELLRDTHFFEIVSNENEIHISLFNVNTSESKHITIQYTRLENKENKNDK